jgi:5-hydroxyisourate hydrolase
VTTHVLDIASGCPAAGLKIELWSHDQGQVHVRSMTTNKDGRTDAPILPESEFAPGTYELRFFAGDYLRGLGIKLDEPAFLDVIPICFGIANERHYHVPLLLSPYGYSTYRGS